MFAKRGGVYEIKYYLCEGKHMIRECPDLLVAKRNLEKAKTGRIRK